MEPDRWERLAESLSVVDHVLDVAMADAVAQGEQAQVGLTHRLHASSEVMVRVGVAAVRGCVASVGSDAFVVRDGDVEWIVPLRAVDTIEGLGPALAWDPRSSAQRTTFAAMLRETTGQAARIHLRERLEIGEIILVGHDHVDIRSGDTCPRTITVPFSAIRCVQRWA